MCQEGAESAAVFRLLQSKKNAYKKFPAHKNQQIISTIRKKSTQIVPSIAVASNLSNIESLSSPTKAARVL